MCGRYALFTLPPELIEKLLGFVPIDEHGLLVPRWNIAPTQRAPVFRSGTDGRRCLDPLRWGLVPPWAESLAFGAKAINARAETAAAKPAFRAALTARRCLVPASGFYEWTKTALPKRPWFFRRADGAPLLLAGLFETWTDEATGEIVETFAILTRSAAPPVAAVHDRMPVAVAEDRWDAWLDAAARDPAILARVLDDRGPELVAVAVGDAVNNSRNDGPNLVAPLGQGDEARDG